ncbi:phosphoesterase RecJ-like protein [Clostridia bacterium]|nr:phosphoesterase RecJ-like protein [Clostridia bacterium]
MITLQKAADILKKLDNIAILTHQYPDGDTLGSGFALCKILQQLGKNAKVLVNGELQEKYIYLTQGLKEQDFKVESIVTVDVADSALLGELKKYKDNVELSIDHHISHKQFAKECYVDHSAAATTEIIYLLAQRLNCNFNSSIANCIYTGLTTDTGCFRYTNTTARTHKIAATMIENGCNSGFINKVMFETVSRQRAAIECKVMSNIRYFANDRGAMIYTTKAMLQEYGVNDDELEGVSSLPRQIVGVDVGVTIREKEDGVYKISMRTNNGVDASKICAIFGGGGHIAAAGCSIKAPLEEVKERIINAVEEYLIL